MALSNQSASLADLGRCEDALAGVDEAVGIYRELAQTHPDTYLADLATALSNPVQVVGGHRAK